MSCASHSRKPLCPRAAVSSLVMQAPTSSWSVLPAMSWYPRSVSASPVAAIAGSSAMRSEP
eukprot:11211666-Lingulodinium_polyedra.AAC.1